ncbi:MAG TPA: molecular chaperone DnaJ [Candidatus Hydrogenedentes bacterium]|nr:molecular chaperone DnaJ [Candidatus Hydrogenedentota bacterium]
MATRDFYEVLGVSRQASQDEIRKAYLKLAHKYHPDKTGGDKVAEDKLKEINEAYDTLKNPDKRSQYDRFGNLGAGFGQGFGGGFGGFGFGTEGTGGFDTPFEDFFDVLFGRSGTRGRRRPAARPGSDLERRVTITLKEAASGVKRTVRFSRMENCGECHGTGAAPGTKQRTCPDCNGSGQVRRSQGFFSITQTCRRCGGRGWSIDEPCTNCRGSGRVQTQRDLSVDIPAGVDTGSRLRVPGEGEPGENDGPRGDLYIFIEVESDDFFVRDGNDLVCEVPVSFPHAALGTTIRVPSLQGEAEVKIPAGTQSGQLFRLRGLGIPDIRGYRTGDQIVRVVVETPTHLNREQKELLQRFQELTEAQNYPAHLRFLDKLKVWLGG